METNRAGRGIRRLFGKAGRDDQRGMLTFVELAVASVIVSLLMLTAVSVMKITNTGTLQQKRRQQAQNMAKEKAEEIKNTIYTGNWNNVLVDERFPMGQTVASPYNSYPPTTIYLENTRFVLDPEVRYVDATNPTTIRYIPTPASAETPEWGDMLRIRVDAYYGKTDEWVPLPTLEAGQRPLRNREVYTNLVNRRRADTAGTELIQGAVSLYSTAGVPLGVARNVEVSAYDGANKIKTAITDNNGIYQLADLPPGRFTVLVDTAPGYQLPPPANQPLNFTNPVTLPAQSLGPKFLKVNPLSAINIPGIVVYTTPAVTPSVTPLPVFVATIPVSQAVVYATDGNSRPTTAIAGWFDIVNAKRTPEPNPVATYTVFAYDGQFSGRGYFDPAAPQPVTIYMNEPVTNNIPVTFRVVEDTGNLLANLFYPITLTIDDDTLTDKVIVATSQSSWGGVLPATIACASGGANMVVRINDPLWPNYQNTSGFITVDSAAATTAPLTLRSYAVGTACGKIYGLGNTDDYTQFQVVASDVSGTYPSVDIPVTHTAGATFGGFRWGYLRIGDVGPGVKSRNYNFEIRSSSGDYNSTNATAYVIHGRSVTLPEPGLLLVPRRAYLYVNVRKGGSAYGQGAFVGAIAGASQPLPAGMGLGYSSSNLYTTATSGQGTALLRVALVNTYPTPTTYTVHTRIIDPVTGLPVTQATTAAVSTVHSASSPLTLNVNFP